MPKTFISQENLRRRGSEQDFFLLDKNKVNPYPARFFLNFRKMTGSFAVLVCCAAANYFIRADLHTLVKI